MDETIVYLDLDGHCIETAAKNEYKKLTASYFLSDTGSDETEINKKLELLYEFIQLTDFSELRASDERLARFKESEAELFRNENGEPVLKLQDK